MQNTYMNSRYADQGSLASRIGDSVPDDVRSTLLSLGREGNEATARAGWKGQLPGMLHLDPEHFAVTVSRMNQRRVDEARKTLSNALERTMEEFGDSLDPSDILNLVARANALLDVLIARNKQLELVTRMEQREASRRKKRQVLQRSSETGKGERPASFPTESTRFQRPASKQSSNRRQPIQQRRRVSVAKLHAGLDHFKLQVRYMDPTEKEDLRRKIFAELEHHKERAKSFVRPDPTREIQALELLAVLGDRWALAERKRRQFPLEPAPLDARSMIYRAHGRTVSGGLPSLGRRY